MSKDPKQPENMQPSAVQSVTTGKPVFIRPIPPDYSKDPEKGFRRISPKRKAFVEASIQDPHATPTEIARQVGLSNGPRHANELAPIIEWRMRQVADNAVLGIRKSLELLSTWAQDMTANMGNRLKAVELLLKVHGALSDKMTLTLDASALKSSLGSLRGELRALPQPTVDAQIMTPSVPTLAEGDAKPLPGKDIGEG